jgi:hypothetical protein
MTAPTTLEILGITDEGRIAYRFDPGDTEAMELSESEVDELARAFGRGFLPLWPWRACRVCGTAAVAVIEDDDLCEGHAMGFGLREDEGMA